MSWDKAEITRATYFSKRMVEDAIEKAAQAKKDTEKKLRRKTLECKACWYYRRGGIVTHGFVQYTCPICNQSFNHGNSAAPKLCVSCADKAVLCPQCGGLRD